MFLIWVFVMSYTYDFTLAESAKFVILVLSIVTVLYSVCILYVVVLHTTFQFPSNVASESGTTQRIHHDFSDDVFVVIYCLLATVIIVGGDVLIKRCS
jgi:hypothetical protein